MIKIGNILLVIFFLIAGFACQQGEKEIIANRIQYDVNIKSPNPDYDWWIQNLPGPQREELVNLIMDGALSGKFQAYDYFNNPISTQEVARVMSDTTYFTLINQDPPYDEKDTTIIYTIVKEDIQRIRFLEEWKLNPDNLTIEKKILGIAPVAQRFDAIGNERWQPLFWIYTDKEFIKELGVGE
jgi:hypothetical protein